MLNPFLYEVAFKKANELGVDLEAWHKEGPGGKRFGLAHHYAREGNMDALQAMQKQGVDIHKPDSKGNTLGHYLMERPNNRTSNFERAAELGVDFSAQNDEGRTPVFSFVATGKMMDHRRVLPQLEKAGISVDLNHQDKEGISVGMLAAYFGTAKDMGALKKAGADFNLPDQNGKTAAFAATLTKNEFAIKAAADVGANFSVQDKDGNTPGHMVAGYEKASLVGAVASAGGSFSLKNNEGKLPSDVASTSFAPVVDSAMRRVERAKVQEVVKSRAQEAAQHTGPTKRKEQGLVAE